MGETLYDVLETVFPNQKIRQMNQGLNGFLESLNSKLSPYSYKDAKRERRSNVRKNDVYDKLIEAFFLSKVLHKDRKPSSLEVSQLSSGEKKKAIIDITCSFLSEHSESGNDLILAIDEPEASLHLSACFDQFESLFEISRNCSQLFFATHWYGFLPIINSGHASVITKINDDTKFDLLNLTSHREQIKQLKSSSKKLLKDAKVADKSKADFRRDISLPHNIRLKSINDFIQSIIASITCEKPYSWLIVEGTSEKIYLSNYFKDKIKNNRLRIIPVGGAVEIKRIYEYLLLAYEDIKEEIKGKVFLLSDTDTVLVQYPCPDDNLPIQSRRIVFDATKNEISLEKNDSNIVSPVTAIEDALDGKIYHSTLIKLNEGNQDFSFLEDDKITTANKKYSYDYLDTKLSQKQLINDFFKQENNKYKFAQAYVQNPESSANTLGWLVAIEKFLFNTK